MTDTKNKAHRGRRGRIKATALALAASLAIFSWSVSSRAEQTLAFTKLVAPVELALAHELLRGEVEPDNYNPATKPKYDDFQWPDTYEKYLLAFVWVARADLNDDGVDEVFYYIEDTGYCGSIGCPMLIFEKRAGAWIEICGTSGGKFTVITDYVTEGGGPYREMEARYRIFWQNGVCSLDSPERLEYDPPPPGRVWKPMR